MAGSDGEVIDRSARRAVCFDGTDRSGLERNIKSDEQAHFHLPCWVESVPEQGSESGWDRITPAHVDIGPLAGGTRVPRPPV